MTAHSARAHARLSPSGAHRWMHCPGSIRMSEGIEEKSSIFADEGTAAHTLAELCLAEALDPGDFLGGKVDVNTGQVFRESDGPADADRVERVFTIDEEMVDAVGLYVEAVRSRIQPGDEVEFEASLDLTHIHGMEKGTGDALVYRPATRHLVVGDLKYGRGVPVEVLDNPQLLAYALGASKRFHNRGVDTIELLVVQPRCPHPDGPVRSQTLDIVDLVEFRLEIERAAAATVAPDAPLAPGDWCKFCPAAPTCDALRGHVRKVAELEFGPPEVAGLSRDDMAEILIEAGVVKDWLKRVEERAHQMARDGEPPTGFKLVASRATRKWTGDEAGTVAALKEYSGLTEDDVYEPPKLKSPAGVERVLGRKRACEIEGLYEKVSSGTILVPESDPRPPVKASAEEEFA